MNDDKITQQRATAVALLRITLGIVILATWYGNLNKGLYTADGFTGFLNWLFDSNGNSSSLGFYKAFLDTAVLPIAGPFSTFQLVTELLLGIALTVGLFTRLAGLVAMFFFTNLFFSYFGGNEWIWLYVLLFMTAFTVTLSAAGRQWGVDQWLQQKYSESKLSILW
ncbi:MAG TPA: DoxX family protein [Anaerolineae bacterium]|nr:DoxX family protein [Anaerolineae bacterium]